MTRIDDAPREGLVNQGILARADRYNRWIVDTLRPWAGRRLLDAGCSIGNLTRHWLDGRERVVAVDIVAEYVRRIRARLGRRPRFHAVRADLADPRLRGLARFRFDTVACVNVLEHIPADEAALANFHVLLRPGGHLLLLVPAGPWLFGTLDESEHHCRRYRSEELRAKVVRAGFRVVRLRAMNLPALAGWLVQGRLLRRRTLPAGAMAAYDQVIPLVAALESLLPPPAGLSLVLVARKP
jgi:2-polyprenyl-3-methyl-5-hydroxy-6-metoxy-1,4-benzoquinol methylase